MIVTIDGREYEAEIDDHGTQRFKGNRVVEKMCMENIHGRLYTPNDLVVDYHKGLFTREEVQEFNILIRYSVSGAMDLSCFERTTVHNPNWGDEPIYMTPMFGED